MSCFPSHYVNTDALPEGLTGPQRAGYREPAL